MTGSSSLATAVVFMSLVYVATLLVIGGFARRAMRERTLSDFFLANRTLGFLVILLTLFATQYSGNSFSAFPGQTYRQGLVYFMTVPFMIGIVTGFLLFAPRLFAIARERRYVTPTDYLADRFASPALSYASAVIFALTLCYFLLDQLMALGHAFAGLTDGRIPYVAAVVGGGLVILAYELLGGMRAVAWTDVLQGIVMGVGIVLVVLLILAVVGSPASVVGAIQTTAPEKVASPDLATCFVWLSNFLLLALGGPLYPQAIQRIYAARKASQLRRALAAMALLPLLAVTAVVFIGVTGILLFPNLQGIDADRITFMVLGYLVEQSELAFVPVLMVMMGVVAAIMSTADSCLLSLSSIFTKDFLARFKRLGHEEAERLTGFAPVFSAAAMIALIAIALNPRITLWGLLVIKFEILIQLSPAFVFGTLHDPADPRGFRSRDVLSGLAVGLVLTLGLYVADWKSVHGFHAGTIGVAFNYAVVLASRSLRSRGVSAAQPVRSG